MLTSYQTPVNIQTSSNHQFHSEKRELITKKSVSTRKSLDFHLTYDNETFWNHSTVMVNEPLAFPSSTHLFILNSTIVFNTSLSNNTGLEIGNNSKLEVYNSTIFCSGNNIYAREYLKFLGGSLILKNCVFDSIYYGVQVWNSTGIVENSTFIEGLKGFSFENSLNINLTQNHFINQQGNGINGIWSKEIRITNSSFEKQKLIGVAIETCNSVEIANSTFNATALPVEAVRSNNTIVRNNSLKNFGLGVRIVGSEPFQPLTQNITVKDNILHSGLRGMVIDGIGRILLVNLNPANPLPFPVMSNVSIAHNHIIDIEGTAIEFRGLNIQIHNNTITKMKTCFRQDSPIFNQPQSFSIVGNNISDCSRYIFSFKGNVGGTSNSERALIKKNIINNTLGVFSFEIIEQYGNTFGRASSMSIYQNAFLNCQEDIISTPRTGTTFGISSVFWDNGLIGNYWDGYSGVDEDNNFVGDTKYLISSDYGLVDNAPLLSLELLIGNHPGSSHPYDITLLETAVKSDNITWDIINSDILTKIVYINGESVEFTENGSIIEVSIASLKLGTSNITLCFHSSTGELIYQDLVWVHILRDESLHARNLLILILGIVSVFGLSMGSIFVYLRKIRNK